MRHFQNAFKETFVRQYLHFENLQLSNIENSLSKCETDLIQNRHYFL